MKILGFLLALLAAPAGAQTITPGPSPGVNSVLNTANASGTLTTTIGMTDGSNLASTSGALTVKPVSLQSYCPAGAITNGATIQIPASCTYAYFTGTGVILAATIKMPASPNDAQIQHLVLPSGLTVTTLTIQDASGNAVTCITCTTILFGSTPAFQFKSTVWQQSGNN